MYIVKDEKMYEIYPPPKKKLTCEIHNQRKYL